MVENVLEFNIKESSLPTIYNISTKQVMNLTFVKQSCCFAALISVKYYNDARHQWSNPERALHCVQGRIQDFGEGGGAQITLHAG